MTKRQTMRPITMMNIMMENEFLRTLTCKFKLYKKISSQLPATVPLPSAAKRQVPLYPRFALSLSNSRKYQ